MARRRTQNITGLKGAGHVDYVSVWRVVECMGSDCQRIFKIREGDWEGDEVALLCPECEYPNPREAYEAAARYKYCRLCGMLQPLDNFHRHKPNSGSFRSGRQLECKVCKNQKINPYLNPLRTADQHREASERRRLYATLSCDAKIDADRAYEIFGGKCFNCGRTLKRVTGGSGYHLDHTLPIRLLWPMSMGATLLCVDCNNAKHERWPSEFYNPTQLRRLAVLTGINFDLLAGPPRFNPEAVQWIRDNIDEFLARWVEQAPEIARLRDRILEVEGVDIYEGATNVPDFFFSNRG
jgi:5-methylcytosine-specific restriction endonuclease McrA